MKTELCSIKKVLIQSKKKNCSKSLTVLYLSLECKIPLPQNHIFLFHHGNDAKSVSPPALLHLLFHNVLQNEAAGSKTKGWTCAGRQPVPSVSLPFSQ